MFWSYIHFLLILMCLGTYDESSGKIKCSLYYCSKSHIYLCLCLREKKNVCQAVILPLSMCFISVRKMLLYREISENSVLERKKKRWRISFFRIEQQSPHAQEKTDSLTPFCFVQLFFFFLTDYTLYE